MTLFPEDFSPTMQKALKLLKQKGEALSPANNNRLCMDSRICHSLIFEGDFNMTDTDKRPSHRAFTVKQIGEGKSRWLEIGAVWLHKDMKGMSVKLDAVPIDGRIEVRAIDWDRNGGDGEPDMPDEAEA